MNWDFIIELLPTLTGLISSGWAGGIALLLLMGLSAYLVHKANKLRDQQDLDNAGADAGNVAVDLRRQAQANEDFIRQERERFERENNGQG